MDLNGTSAIVTGGASGLGEATSRLLAERGVHVVVADLPVQEDKGAPLAKEIGGLFVPTDVTNAETVIAAVEAAIEMAPLKSLVNCAGIGWATRTIGKDGDYASAHDLDLYRRVIEINLIGTFNCVRLAATKMSLNEPDAGRRPRRHREHGVRGGRGRADRAGRLLILERRRRGHDPPGGSRPGRRRHPGQLHPAGADRHADLRRRRGIGGVQEQAGPGRALPAPPGSRHRVRHARAWSCSPTRT